MHLKHTLVNVLSNQKPEHPCSPSTPQPPLPNPSTLSLIFDLFLHEDIMKKEGLLASKWKEISAYLDWWNEWSFQECPLFTPTGIKVCFIYLWMSPMAFAHSFSPLFAGANWSRQWRCLRIGFLHSPSKLECVCVWVCCMFVCVSVCVPQVIPGAVLFWNRLKFSSKLSPQAFDPNWRWLNSHYLLQ